MIKVMVAHLRDKSDAILMKQDCGKRTALHLAAQRVVAATVKVKTMLACLKENAGAIMMIRDKQGFSPLHYAARGDNAGAFEVMLKCLKEKASTVMVMLGWDNKTPLHLAASRGDAAKVKTILEYLETEIACPLMAMEDIHNCTPLHSAIKGSHTATVKVMLEYLGEDASAKIIIGGDQGNTPLHWAAASGDAAMVKMMLGHLEVRDGVIMTMQDEELSFGPGDETGRGGRTPLHCAAAENGNETTVVAILEYLAETSIAGNPMDLLDHQKCTPLHLAARGEKVPIIKAMLRYLKKTEGALCLTMKDNEGMLPLEYPEVKQLAQEADFAIETVPK